MLKTKRFGYLKQLRNSIGKNQSSRNCYVKSWLSHKLDIELSDQDIDPAHRIGTPNSNRKKQDLLL